MKFILGRKLDMTQIFDEDGKVVSVTLVEVEPNVVVQIKTKEKDGYEAIQIGSGSKKSLTKPLKGHVKDLGNFRYLKELRSLTHNDQEVKAGDKWDVSILAQGDLVKVAAVTKGKGFQGAVKRHGFKGMPASHGHRSVQRHIGSIGQRFPQHTLKGKRMAGHMGNRNLTVRGLKIIKVDAEKGIVAIKGAIPGNRGGLVQIISQ